MDRGEPARRDAAEGSGEEIRTALRVEPKGEALARGPGPFRHGKRRRMGLPIDEVGARRINLKGRPDHRRPMVDDSSGEPIDLLMRSTRDLLRPEEIVRDATRDIIKDEVRRHIEKTLHDDPKLSQDLREAVRQLMEARALEYAALLRVGTLTARLGLSTLPPNVRQMLTRDLANLVSAELGQIVEKTL